MSQGAPPTLAGLIRVVVANNPGPLTGPGTNSYLVGRERIAIVDPGPDEAAHLDALLEAAAPGRVTHILTTHHHADHAGGAAGLAARTGAAIVAASSLDDGTMIEDEEWRLEAVATPGHTRDHFCFALSNYGVLLSGDHVMGWSSSMIAWPDGRMGDYFASLEKLMGRSEGLYLPGHGEPIGDGKGRVRELFEHRKSRESAILASIGNEERSVRSIVEAVYPPLGPKLVQAAEFSVLAHLDHLAERGLVQRTGPATNNARYRATGE